MSKEYRIDITGKTPLLMHADNIEWADKMDAWKKDPKNKSKSKPGDDRTPPWRWLGCLYHDGQHVSIPSENVMRCIMEGAAEVPTGKGKKTYKSQSQSGIICHDFHWPLIINDVGLMIDMPDINALLDDEFEFHDDIEMVQKMGFSLFVKRARIGNAKHIRVRPRFDNWFISGSVTVIDETITKDILITILEVAGSHKGLGDWRPGAKTPGPWGIFSAKVTTLKN